MTFLDADVKRLLAHVGATVDEGNVVVFGQQDSYIENMSTGHRIPMRRRNGAFVVQLDAQDRAETTKKVRFDVPNTTSVFRREA